MKTLFIDQLKPDTGSFDDFFQVSSLDRKTTSQGKPYLLMKLKDRTGELTANLWDIPEDCPALVVGNVVKVRAETTTYRDALQLKVTKLRVAARDEITLDDYLPASKHDRGELLERVQAELRSISREGLRHAMLNLIMTDTAPLLRDAPAAKKNHQAYLGGLLEHTLNLMALARGVSAVYPDLDLDILLAAAFVHDIGKCWELCYQDHIGYTRQGSTLGHIVMGVQFLTERCNALDPVIREHLLHILVSHHGQREWGSPVVPITREAQVFHLLDMIDSRMGLMDTALAAGVDQDGLTGYNNSLGSAVWNGGR